jgi:hypothetical protein
MDGAQDREPAPTDRYYRGTILRLNPGSRSGWLRSERGREIPFAARDLRLVGNATFETLREGQQVGFDLGRTSSGLCVTVIRVYEAAR